MPRGNNDLVLSIIGNVVMSNCWKEKGSSPHWAGTSHTCALLESPQVETSFAKAVPAELR
jgi:hypothetical protein